MHLLLLHSFLAYYFYLYWEVGQVGQATQLIIHKSLQRRDTGRLL